MIYRMRHYDPRFHLSTYLCQTVEYGPVASCHDPAAVWVEVQVSHRLPQAQAERHDGVGVRVDDVHEVGVGGVKAGEGRRPLERQLTFV